MVVKFQNFHRLISQWTEITLKNIKRSTIIACLVLEMICLSNCMKPRANHFYTTAPPHWVEINVAQTDLTTPKTASVKVENHDWVIDSRLTIPGHNLYPDALGCDRASGDVYVKSISRSSGSVSWLHRISSNGDIYLLGRTSGISSAVDSGIYVSRRHRGILIGDGQNSRIVVIKIFDAPQEAEVLFQLPWLRIDEGVSGNYKFTIDSELNYIYFWDSSINWLFRLLPDSRPAVVHPLKNESSGYSEEIDIAFDEKRRRLLLSRGLALNKEGHNDPNRFEGHIVEIDIRNPRPKPKIEFKKEGIRPTSLALLGNEFLLALNRTQLSLVNHDELVEVAEFRQFSLRDIETCGPDPKRSFVYALDSDSAAVYKISRK